MPVSWQLAIKQWRIRPLRPLLCILAVAAAVALIQGAGTGFDSAKASFMRGMSAVTGNADIHVRPGYNTGTGGLPPTVLAQIRAMPQVKTAAGRMQTQAAVRLGSRTRVAGVIGVDVPQDQAIRPQTYTAGNFLTSKSGQVVLDSSLAAQLQAHVGQTVRILSAVRKKPLALRVVGIFHATPLKLILQHPSCLVSIQTLAHILALPVRYHDIDLKLKPGISTKAFAAQLRTSLGREARITTAAAKLGRLKQQMQSIDLTMVALAVSSSIAAAFIIGSTLAVGLEERVRQFGTLRCIGASRKQLIAMLLIEAFLLMAPGCVLGVSAGTLIARLATAHFPRVFPIFHISAATFEEALACGVFATLLGSLLPLWQLLQVTPMQAVQIMGRARRAPSVYIAAVAGALALGLQALLWQIPDVQVRFWVYVLAGIPLIFIGWAMFAPLALTWAAPLMSRLCGAVFRVRPELLRTAWSRTLWRAGVMIAALMIGAALFGAIRTRGKGLQASWRFPTKFPDLFLDSLFAPFHRNQIKAIAKSVPAIKQICGISAFYVRAYLPSAPNQPVRLLYAATQPRLLRHMLALRVIGKSTGNPFTNMTHRRNVIIGVQAMRRLHLHTGDRIAVETSLGMRNFTIAAVVDAPGLDLAKRFFNVRGIFHNTAASSVMGTLGDAHRYFQLAGANMLLMTTMPGAPQAATLQKVKQAALRGMKGGMFTSMLKGDLGIQGASSQRMKQFLHRLISRIVRALTIIAIGVMAIACVGVANLVIAAIHTRRFELGLLRSIGAGRWQIMRLVLGEISMLCLVAWALGTAVGLQLAFMATQIDRAFLRIPSKYLISYSGIGWAFAATAALAVVASAWPAWRAASASQRALLAAGRA